VAEHELKNDCQSQPYATYGQWLFGELDPSHSHDKPSSGEKKGVKTARATARGAHGRLGRENKEKH